jgi:hypothetical protein
MSSRPVLPTAVVLVVCLALLGWGLQGVRDPADLLREGYRDEALEQRLVVVRQVSAGKREVTAEVLAGRLTLREAAERFRQLNALLDNGTAPRAGTEEERCLYVIYWAQGELPEQPGGAAVLARLEEQYRREFGHAPGPLSYPSGP